MHVADDKPRSGIRGKLPFILAMVAIIAALGAVITVVAVVVIAKRTKPHLAGTFATPGTNLLVVLPARKATTLTWDDLAAIRTAVPSVSTAAPQLTSKVTVLADDANWSTTVTGTTPEYFDIRGWKVTKGALFTESDSSAAAKSIVIGQTVSDSLFGSSVDPIGHMVRLRTVPFEIIGVLERKGRSAAGQDYDDLVVVPQTTFQAKIQNDVGKYLRGNVLVKAKSSDESAEKEIASLLRDRHRLSSDAADDFEIRKLTEVASPP